MSVNEQDEQSEGADVRDLKLAQLQEQVRVRTLQVIEGVMEIIDTRFDVFATWASEAAMGIDGENPLLHKKAGKVEPVADYCADIARVLLSKLTGDSQSEKPAYDGYVSVSEWITSRIKEPRRVYSVSFDRALKHARSDFLVFDFFDKQEELFGEVAQWALELVYHGVPLYTPEVKGIDLQVLPYSHEDYVYLAKKGEYCDSTPLYKFPFWAKAYYFNRAHLDAHAVFFSAVTFDLSKEAIAALRAAFRKYIRIEAEASTVEGSWLRTDHSSLLQLVNKVLERYYGSTYVRTDPNTWTTQSVIVEWLKTTFGVSDRQANAIDIVTRPDQQRRQSR